LAHAGFDSILWGVAFLRLAPACRIRSVTLCCHVAVHGVENVVYDNGFNQAIEGGSFVVHK